MMKDFKQLNNGTHFMLIGVEYKGEIISFEIREELGLILIRQSHLVDIDKEMIELKIRTFISNYKFNKYKPFYLKGKNVTRNKMHSFNKLLYVHESNIGSLRVSKDIGSYTKGYITYKEMNKPKQVALALFYSISNITTLVVFRYSRTKIKSLLIPNNKLGTVLDLPLYVNGVREVIKHHLNPTTLKGQYNREYA